MTTHTPGPWYEMTKGDNVYQSAICEETTGKTVALTYTSNDADARLIAAAPELLQALKDLVQCARERTTTRIEPGSYLDVAIQTIAKAEGRA